MVSPSSHTQFVLAPLQPCRAFPLLHLIYDPGSEGFHPTTGLRRPSPPQKSSKHAGASPVLPSTSYYRVSERYAAATDTVKSALLELGWQHFRLIHDLSSLKLSQQETRVSRTSGLKHRQSGDARLWRPEFCSLYFQSELSYRREEHEYMHVHIAEASVKRTEMLGLGMYHTPTRF